MVSEKKLDNGNILQIMSDVTFLKKQEKELKRLQLGIEQVNSGVSFWSDDNKLIYANKFLRDFTKKSTGYDLVAGTDRIEYLEHSVSKGPWILSVLDTQFYPCLLPNHIQCFFW